MANVIIKNKLNQTLTLSLKDGSGTVELKLAAYGSSAPVSRDALTPQVQNAQRRGQVVVMPA